VKRSRQQRCRSFNLFDNPVVWIKTQLHERTQMNMMGNLVEPFESTRRFRVTFEALRPTFTLGLLVEGNAASSYTGENHYSKSRRQ